MIYTVTLNPSVDYFITLDQLTIGTVNRVKQDKKMPGGKGINVSRVLKSMAIQSKALGFIGGFTGEYIQTCLKTEGIQTDFVEVEDETRINVKIKADQETELNGAGPSLSSFHLEILLSKLATLNEEDWLVLSGSVPSSLPHTIYQTLIDQATQLNAKTIVDTTGDSLKQTLKFRPFLVKPNHHELEAFFEQSFRDLDDVAACAKRLLNEGPQNVVVSMGGEGALLVNKTGVYLANVPKGEVMNSVGSGDSLVAGFLGHYSQNQEVLEAFRYGVAAGSATAFSVDLCSREMLESVLPEVSVKVLERVN